MKLVKQLSKDDICDLTWLKRKTPPKLASKSSLNVIDLFCGCGGMSLGIREGLRLNNISTNFLLALDSNNAALNVYSSNLKVPSNKLVSSEIQNLFKSTSKSSIKKNFSLVDLLVAGPPCQGHSTLNNHTRMEDERNLLYLQAIHFAEITLPKVVIIENVSNVTNDKNKVTQKSTHKLEDLGYVVQNIGIDAHKHFGMAQSRKRHLLIATYGESFNTSNILSLAEKQNTLKDYIGDIQDEYMREKEALYFQPSQVNKVNKVRMEYLFKKNIYDLPNRLRPKCHQSKHSYVSMYGRLDWNKPAQTITSGFGSMGQGRYVHPSQKRTLTPHEAARIQGFPDCFSFDSVQTRGELHTMIANAVPPKVMAVIVNELVQQGVL